MKGKGTIIVTCFCGEKRKVVPSEIKRRAKYCGRKCVYEGQKGLLVGQRHWNWKGGKYITRGYKKVKAPHHPFADCRGYVREHTLVMEKFLSDLSGTTTYLNPEQVVHHINGNKKDNRIENLLLFKNNGKHTHFHKLQKRLKA